MKRGPVVIIGHDYQVELIASRVKSARLYADSWQTQEFIQGATLIRPPEMPGNIAVNPDEPPGKIGMLILFDAVPVGAGLQFVCGARIMGPVKHVKPLLRGKKFTILSCWQGFLCVELANL